MPKLLEIYKCELCGNIVEVETAGTGQLVCCGKPMVVQVEKNADSTTEKHVPLIEKIDGGYKVTVGSTLHPMKPEHYIEWIELLADGKAYRRFLKPGDEPIAYFCACKECSNVSAREYCNVHGLWKS
jgi:superoxide reductase